MPDETDLISIKQMPEVDAVAKCTLPVLVTAPEQPEYPGIAGSCFAVRFGGRVFFLTAAHVAKPAAGSIVQIGIGFDEHSATCPIGLMTAPIPAADDVDGMDFVLMWPRVQPSFVSGQSAALDIESVADLQETKEGTLFAVLGYPRDHPADVGTDYEKRELGSLLWHGLGKYDGRSSLKGLHRVRLETSDIGGPQGLSGGAVLRLGLHDGRWSGALAGITVLGGPELIHFSDVRNILALLVREAPSLRAAAEQALLR